MDKERDPPERESIPTEVSLEDTFKSLSAPYNWKDSGAALLFALRKVGTRLQKSPLEIFAGIAGSSLCSDLRDCLEHLIPGLHATDSSHEVTDRDERQSKSANLTQQHKERILATCVSLVSLVAGRCLSYTLYLSASDLLISALSAVDAVINSCHGIKRNCVESCPGGSAAGSGPAISFTVDPAVLERLLGSLIMACSLGCYSLSASSSCTEVKNSVDSAKEISQTTYNTTSEEESDNLLYKSYSPIMYSSYGPEFLYGLCSEMILRVGEMRSDIKGAERAVDWTTGLYRAALKLGVIKSRESDLMGLYVRSHCLWNAPSVSGASSGVSVEVIDGLKSIGETIDSEVMDTVAAGKGKVRAKRAPKEIKNKDLMEPSVISISDTIQSFSSNLRTWILLSLWGLPLTYSQVESQIKCIE